MDGKSLYLAIIQKIQNSKIPKNHPLPPKNDALAI
jgi:hypothetical protein